MELYQLNYVLAVAKHQNFSRAAAEVSVTPSSLSQQIKKLEEELGVVLFVRTTRSVHLTRAGMEFVENAKKIMSDLVRINTTMQKYVVGESGQLSIGSLPALKAFGILPLIFAFQKSYPKITLDIHEAECLELYPLLYKGKIDAAFLTAFEKGNPRKIPLEAYPLFTDELVLLVSKSHPLASKESIHLSEVKQETFISFSKASGLYLDTLDACHAAGFEPNFAYSAQYVDTCLGFVAEGMGIAMLSSRTVTNTLWKNIAMIRVKPKITRTLSLVFPKKRKMPPVLSNFVNFFTHLPNDLAAIL